MSSPSAIGTIGQEKRENQAFIYLDRHFLSKGLPVPRIFAVADDLSAYLQEDMGEVMLNDVVDNARKSGDFGPITAILEQCMRQLVRFQFDAGEDLKGMTLVREGGLEEQRVLVLERKVLVLVVRRAVNLIGPHLPGFEVVGIVAVLGFGVGIDINLTGIVQLRLVILFAKELVLNRAEMMQQQLHQELIFQVEM